MRRPWFVRKLLLIDGACDARRPLMGVATGFDALAGVVGCLCGAALIEKFPAWHYMLLGCMVWTGLAFGAWTAVWDFGSMLVAATAWGLLSVVPTQTTQAALTWVWGADCAPHISVLNAGFGLGSLVAPILVSLDLSATNSFHNAYWAIGLANVLCGIPLLRYPSPQSNDKGDSNAPALTFKEPAHWRKMLTGRESQAEPGGQWQLWALWYSFFFWCALVALQSLPSDSSAALAFSPSTDTLTIVTGMWCARLRFPLGSRPLQRWLASRTRHQLRCSRLHTMSPIRYCWKHTLSLFV